MVTMVMEVHVIMVEYYHKPEGTQVVQCVMSGCLTVCVCVCVCMYVCVCMCVCMWQ